MNRLVAILFAIALVIAPSSAFAGRSLKTKKLLKIVDNCAAVVPTMLAFGDSLQASGTTAGKADDFGTTGWHCGDERPGSAPDVVFAVTLPAEGVLDIQATALGFDPALYLQTACGVEYACFDVSSGGSERILGDYPAGTYYVAIDGHGATGGAFILSVAFDAPACGDGVFSPGEQCDDGNTGNGDGCDASCLFETPAPGTDVCPGEAVALPMGTTILSGTTNGYANDYSGSCSYPPGGDEHVYAVTPAISGMLTATVGLGADGTTDVCAGDVYAPECWDRTLYARSTCASASAELGCSDAGAMNAESISVPTVAGVPVFLFVDGYDDQYYSRGPYHLRLDLN